MSLIRQGILRWYRILESINNVFRKVIDLCHRIVFSQPEKGNGLARFCLSVTLKSTVKRITVWESAGFAVMMRHEQRRTEKLSFEKYLAQGLSKNNVSIFHLIFGASWTAPQAQNPRSGAAEPSVLHDHCNQIFPRPECNVGRHILCQYLAERGSHGCYEYDGLSCRVHPRFQV